MSALVHCIYTSVQTSSMTGAELALLVERSRASNQAHGITGLLLHARNTFFQVLEGPPTRIEALYSKILVDPRHTRITRIIYEPIAKRYFEDLTMSLAILTSEELASLLEDHSPERLQTLLSGLDEGRAKRLIRAFSEGRWRAKVSPGSAAAGEAVA